MRHLAVFIFIFFTCSQVFSHEVAEDNNVTASLYSDLIHQIAELTIQDHSEGRNYPIAKFEKRGPVRRLFFGSKTIEVNDAFWNATDKVTTVLLNEIEKSCETCKIPSIDEVGEIVESKVNQGWTSKIAYGLASIVIERYGGAFVTLASRYGYAAGVLKVIGELVEDALLVVLKMPNAHMLCEVITALVAANTAGFNTFWRSFTHAGNLGYSRIVMLSRLAATSRTVRRAMDRVQIEMPAFQIKDEELRNFVEEHPDKKLGHKLGNYVAHKLQHSSWSGLNRMGESYEEWLAKRHRLTKFLKKTDKAQARARKKLESKDLSPEERQEWERELTTQVYLKKKVFLGKRYKRFLFLKKRKGTSSLGDIASETKEPLRGSAFWFFSLKNELLMPNVEFQNSSYQTREPIQTVEDPMAQHLASQFSDEPQAQDFLKQLFSTLDGITDRSLPLAQRRQNFVMAESFIRYLMPNLINELVSKKLSELKGSDMKLLSRYNFRSLVGKTFYETDLFVDMLRFLTVSNNPKNPNIEYFVRDYFVEILDMYKFISEVDSLKNQQDLTNYNGRLKKRLKELKAKRFWVDKTQKTFSLSNLMSSTFSRAKVCESLY